MSQGKSACHNLPKVDAVTWEEMPEKTLDKKKIVSEGTKILCDIYLCYLFRAGGICCKRKHELFPRLFSGE